MAAPKSEKKKISAKKQKTVLERKKTKKVTPAKPRPKPKPAPKKAEKEKARKTIKVPQKQAKIKLSAAPPPPPVEINESARKAILTMRQKLLAEISEKPIPETLIATTDIGDLIDQAGDERDREMSLLLTGRDKEKLQSINEALEKIREGSYGVCEECGDKIGPGRLKVMPLAKYCVSCQSKLEKEISLLRKAEEDLQYRGLAYSSGAEEEEI
ncbi:MAG: molecular chaperone DnaK [Deltaproteobacteria bacterium]|jgi:DnaK suppressor protein|nr:molecular chaperone DnaK [Deltaproteobacteria bacterium]